MGKVRLSGKLAVILHADVAGSTELVQQDEQVAHKRIQETFRRFGDAIIKYQGHVRELRGDALMRKGVIKERGKRYSAALAEAEELQSPHTAPIPDET